MRTTTTTRASRTSRPLAAGASPPSSRYAANHSARSLSLEIAHEIECGAVRRHHWHLRHLDRQGLLLSNDPGAQLASRLDAIGPFDMAHQSTMNAQSSHSFQSNPISLIHRVSDNPHPTNQQTIHSISSISSISFYSTIKQNNNKNQIQKTRDIDPSLSITLTNSHKSFNHDKHQERDSSRLRETNKETQREFSRSLSIKRCCRLQALLSHRNIESTHRDLVDEMHHTTLPSSTSMLAPSRVDLPRSEQCHHRHTRSFLSIEM